MSSAHETNARRLRRHLSLFGITAALLAAGCTGVESDSADIIGGVEASGRALDAVGALGSMSGETFRPFCTATLIEKDLVLTAKHCVLDNSWFGSGGVRDEVYFAIGPDANDPRKVVRSRKILVSPIDEGGFVKLGSDVALVMLEEPVRGVTPFAYLKAHIRGSTVGNKYSVIGYGVQDNDGTLGTRRAGQVTLQAVEGRPMKAIFGDKWAFKRHIKHVEGEAFLETNKTRLDELWEFELLEGYEAYVGVGEGDAQPCSGDSGGPLVKRRPEGELVVAGVVSGSFKGSVHRCSILGESYATLGEEVQDLIASAIGPCDGLSSDGVCDGDVARRCVLPSEGMERITETDCSALGQVCSVQSGAAACADPPEDPDPAPPEDPPEDPEDPQPPPSP